MNLKEAFRYQSFLDDLMSDAKRAITASANATKVVEHHKCSKANAEAKDFDETTEPTGELFECKDLMAFMATLVEEREKLGKAITAAKAKADIDIDAAAEANKFRRVYAESLRSMLRYTDSVRKTQGTGYRFNAEGNQMPYRYDIEVEISVAFDRAEAKKTMLDALKMADEVSHQIDAIKVNTEVADYEPPFDVNGSFADAMETFTDKAAS